MYLENMKFTLFHFQKIGIGSIQIFENKELYYRLFKKYECIHSNFLKR